MKTKKLVEATRQLSRPDRGSSEVNSRVSPGSTSASRNRFPFLPMSKDKQPRRFLQRLDLPRKNGRFPANDASERVFWDDSMRASEDPIREAATKHAPWYVVPADNKGFTRVVVAAAVVDARAALNLEYPKVNAAKRAERAEARASLLAAGK